MPTLVRHTARPTLPDELEHIRTLFLQMCVRAESMVASAVRSIFQQDLHLARGVVAADEAMDDLEVEIDDLCVRFLAQGKPGGYDLRLVMMILKSVTDLERIGDLAVNIAERCLDLGALPGMRPSAELAAMGHRVVEMIRTASDSFVHGDAEMAARLSETDDEVDALHRDGFARLLRILVEHPDQAECAMTYTSISRYLERVGDHAVNVGQMVVLLVDARDVRHQN